MLGAAAPGETRARAGVRLPRRSRVPNREAIRGTDRRLNSDWGIASAACELVAPTTTHTIFVGPNSFGRGGLFGHVFWRDDLGQRLDEGGNGIDPVRRYVRVDHDHERGVLLRQVIGPGVVAG